MKPRKKADQTEEEHLEEMDAWADYVLTRRKEEGTYERSPEESQ